MKRYDKYGFRNTSLEEAVKFVEGALGIQMRLRDSSYRGLYYCAGNGPLCDYSLDRNEGETFHSKYPDYSVILQVNNVPDMDAIKEKLTAGRTDPVMFESETVPTRESAYDDD
jgi:hypothetical protein